MIMAFKGKYPQRSKIIIDDYPLEPIKHFNYLDCNITYNQNNINKKSSQIPKYM
jgi:hypothetical protein